MKDVLRRLLLWLVGELVSKRVVEELLTSVLTRLKEEAARTDTPIDDAVLEAVEAAFLNDATLELIRKWLEDRIVGRSA